MAEEVTPPVEPTVNPQDAAPATSDSEQPADNLEDQGEKVTVKTSQPSEPTTDTPAEENSKDQDKEGEEPATAPESPNQPVKSEVAAPITTGPVGTAVEPVEVQERFTRLFNEVDNVISRVESSVAAHVDVTNLRDSLTDARDWLAEKLGLQKQADGSYLTHAGYAGGNTSLGQTTGQTETPKTSAVQEANPSAEDKPSNK